MTKKKSWFKARGYLHLTNKINSEEKILRVVSNPDYITKHAFFPLLHKKINQRRYKVIGIDKVSKKNIRSHKKIKNGITKSTSKVRPIHYATHLDASIYSYYSNEILQDEYEKILREDPTLNKCITAYRKIKIEGSKSGKSNIHFAKDVFDEIRKRGDCYAMAFDIESFFTNLDHSLVKKSWCKLLNTKKLPKDHYNIFKSVTNFSYMNLVDFRNNKGQFNEKEIATNHKKGIQAFFESPKLLRDKIKAGEINVYKNQRKNKKKKLIGIPQGLPISAMLANLYLLEFDRIVCQEVMKNSNGFYRRYSDDIVVVCQEKDKDRFKQLLKCTIEKFRLSISDDKTEVRQFKKIKVDGIFKLKSFKENDSTYTTSLPFNYLGFEFYGEKTLIKSKNIAKFYRRMKAAINSKINRIEKVKIKYSNSNQPIFKRKLYRIYTYHGRKSRKWKIVRTKWEKNLTTNTYVQFKEKGNKKFRGNYLHYVNRAAKIMEEPAISKQLRNHFKILKKHMNSKF